MAAGKVEYDHVSKPPVKKHDIKSLDLAFVMDATGSMGSYIESAKNNICKIVEEIVASEKSDVRLALVNYRDHPPQESSFVTEVHDFTTSPGTMKSWLRNTSATGGGDTPEAVADALHDSLKLSWREEATKICVCISDAPPHGLGCSNDGFPEGCPAGIDPIEAVHQMAGKGITLYVVGCEPSITPYKNFFMAIAFTTGGQYVPLIKAQVLCQVIVGGAREEMSLERLMEEVNEEVQADLAAGLAIDEDDMTKRVHAKMAFKGIRSTQLQRNKAELSSAHDNEAASKLSKLTNLKDVRKEFKPNHTAGLTPRSAPRGMGYRMRSARMPTGSCTMDEYEDTVEGVAIEDTYEAAEMPITVAQASRMVRKCVARCVPK
ncbi:uncharacterized protein LOC127844871 [Dreissena polymorpha]|uniref:VWFA domain-containing protein n=1 Tax=Dreissena polymorpha TaxID=45954 RepID=A0A9D4EBT6_DREPO|nr:uncharacterized protein LOC127844871 [Dreissena polymorpha]KAH3776410.1 hypothetical protein DPMN_177833 [Dreissena polymorpha]